MALTVMVELVLLQVIGVALSVAVSCGGCEMVTVVVAVQPLSSVTVKVWVPAGLLNVPVPVYGGVPPVAATVTVAFSP